MANKRVCRLGDKSSHGGTIITATGPVFGGKPVALEGDLHKCANGKHGTCRLVSSSQNYYTWNNRRVIVEGDTATCGAIMLAGDYPFTIDC